MTDDSYDRYVRAEWALLTRDAARIDAARAAVAGLRAARVLDIGCGAGQELRPIVGDGAGFGVGIDASPDVGAAGRQLFARDHPRARVAFLRGAAERLPFPSSTFDVVICRLALPYTDNARALAEMARVMTPQGALILKYHHARFYVTELGQALAAGRMKTAIHAVRVLLAGCIYHASGVQPRGRLTGGEAFQTMWLLRRELEKQGLQVRRLLPDSVPEAPSLWITRRA